MTRTKTERLDQEEERRRGPPQRTWLVRLGSAAHPMERPAAFELEDSRFEIGREAQPDLDDPFLSGRHAEVVHTVGGWALRDLGSSNGTFHLGEKKSSAMLSDGDVFETGATFWVFRSQPRHDELPVLDPADTLASMSPELCGLVDRIRRVARTRVPVLLLGETGTGKEVLARALHDSSGRTGPFVAINTAAIQKTLVASELFGVEKGAHSTAERARVGQVRAADKGTLLLDEIGDMPLEVQVSLLRMLQESEVTPVGGDAPIKVDVRVLCATHQNLAKLVDDGRFRADLYARINGTVLRVPELAERPEDIGLLIGRFLERYGGTELSFSTAAYRALVLYPWPHNVRELEKAIEAGIALAERDRIELSHLPEDVQSFEPKKAEAGAEGETLEETYERELRRLLAAHQGNVSAVARSMGRSRMQIHRWLKRLSLDPDDFRG